MMKNKVFLLIFSFFSFSFNAYGDVNMEDTQLNVYQNTINSLLNRNADEVIEILKKENKSYRIVGIDDEMMLVTADYRTDRFNLTIRNNIVINIQIF